MGYNKKNYARIRAEYQTKFLKAHAEADRRTAELHQKSAELAEIDRALAHTGVEIAMAALGTGEEYQTKLAAVEKKNTELQVRRAALLENMGYPADYTVPPYECPKCKDSGFVGVKMCDCMRRDLIMAAYASSGLGRLLQSQSFDNFDLSFYKDNEKNYALMKDTLEQAKKYAEQFSLNSGNLIFLGKTGLGKTHLSTAVARCVIDRGFDVYYTGAIEMFEDFERARFGYGEERREAGEALERYTECDLLILDDLGAETVNQFTTSCLYAVLNNRINMKKPTIISTNLTGPEIKERYAERISSRIFGEFSARNFLGSDIRRQKLSRK